jgi:hypothetical protein
MNIKYLWNNKWSILKNANVWINKSPLAVVIAIVFIIDPVVSGTIGIIGDYTWVRQKLDPSQRPVTAAEFKLLDDQVDAIQASLVEINSKLVVKKVITPDAPKAKAKPVVVVVEADASGISNIPSVGLSALNKFEVAKVEREKLSKKLDVAYLEKKPKF